MEHFAGKRHIRTLTDVIQTEIENGAFQALLCYDCVNIFVIV